MALEDRTREDEELLLASQAGRLLNEAEKAGKAKEIRISDDIYCSRKFLGLLTDIIEMGGYPGVDLTFFKRNKDKLTPEHYEIIRRLPIVPTKPRGTIFLRAYQRRKPRPQPLPEYETK